VAGPAARDETSAAHRSPWPRPAAQPRHAGGAPSAPRPSGPRPPRPGSRGQGQATRAV